MDQPNIVSTNPDYLIGLDGGHPVRVPINAPDGQRANIGLSQAQIAAGATGVAGVTAKGAVSSLSGGGVVYTGTHVSATCLGDSIASRNFLIATGGLGFSGCGIYQWCNAVIGAPFVLSTNLGVSGDLTRSIMTRAALIPRRDQIVFVHAGTNDMLAVSSGASAETVSASIATWSGYLTAGINALRAAGKKVVISTIIPNNAMTLSTDARISWLDQANTFINTLHDGSSVWVIDAFTPMWDETQPTLRKGKADALNSDGTHPTMAGCLRVATNATNKSRLAAAFNSCIPNVDIYDGFQPVRSLYGAFRSGTGGQAPVLTAGTGTLGDGWRTLNNAGTATFTLSNAEAYSLSSDFVGPWAEAPMGIDEKFQAMTVTSAAASDNPYLRNPAATDLTNTTFDVMGGNLTFAEIEIDVQSPVNLQHAELRYRKFFAAGTSPADQPFWIASTEVYGSCGLSTDHGSTAYAVPTGFRAVLRTPVVRLPENINTTTGQQGQIQVSVLFNGTGSASIRFARPRIWTQIAGRIG